MLFIIIFQNIIKLKDRSVILKCLKLQYVQAYSKKRNTV